MSKAQASTDFCGPPLRSPWTSVRLGHLATFHNGVGLPMPPGDVGELCVPVIGSGGIFGSFAEPLYHGPGVVLGRKGTLDRPVLIDGPCWVTDTAFFLKARASIETRFLYYSAMTIPFGYYATDTALPSMTQTALASHRITLPPQDEQEAIADYLDHEIGRINELVAQQERLIATLRERRQAVIDQHIANASVNAPTVSLRRGIQVLTSGSRGWGGFYADTGHRFARIANLSRDHFKLRGDVQHVDLPDGVAEGTRTRLQVGDLLFSITAYLGSVGIVPREWEDGYVSQHVALCRLDPRRWKPEYVAWAMLSTAGQHQLRESAAGGTKMQLALDDIKELRVPLPAVDIQLAVIDSVGREVAVVDDLISNSQRFIELAKERRAALITAAVTGQLDILRAS